MLITFLFHLLQAPVNDTRHVVGIFYHSIYSTLLDFGKKNTKKEEIL